MTYTTGNSERDSRLRRSIGEVIACNEPLSFEAIAANLPKDFELEDVEAEGMAREMGLLDATPLPGPTEHDGTQPIFEGPTPKESHMPPMILENPDGHSLIPPEPLDNFALSRASEIEPPVSPPADATPQPKMTQQQASDAVLAAHDELQEARLEYRRTQDATRAARAALATSITVWQSGAPVYTQQDLIRDHIAASNAARAQRKEQGIPTQAKQVGKSYIDRAAAYSRDNTPEGAARSRMKHGASRGAFPKAMHGRINYDPSRGPVPKLPSER